MSIIGRTVILSFAGLVMVLLSSCSANETNSAEFDNSGISDCGLVYEEFQKAEEFSRLTTDKKVAERRAEIIRATAVVEGRDSYQDFLNGEYLDEWRIYNDSFALNDNEYWKMIMKEERKKQVLKSAAYLWPQVTDPDLKSALRDLSQDSSLESNLIAIKSVCPDVSLGTF